MVKVFKKWISKIIISMSVVSMLSTGFVAYADGNEDAFSYNFVYREYGEAINRYSEWSQKLTSSPVYAYCESATSTFAVRLVGCVNDFDSPSSAIAVSGTYYLGTGTYRNIANTALTNQPNRAWVALEGIYQGDNRFSAIGHYVPH